MPLIPKHNASIQTDFNLASIGRTQQLIEQTDDNLSNEDEIKEQKSISGESSDSGTAVNDLEEDDDEDDFATKSRRRSNSTRTIESASKFNERPPSALSEAQVFQHRNEVRRLRTRISNLEIKNRVNF